MTEFETCETCGAPLIDDEEESWPYCPNGHRDLDDIFDDLFDAELAVERSGHAFFDKADLAELLGISAKSVSVLRVRGKIPAPDHYREPDGRRSGVSGGRRRAVWTPAQAARLLKDRK